MSRVVVVHLKKSEMEVFAVESGHKAINAETTWTAEDLADKLRLVKTKFDCKSIRVLLADELAYTKIKKLQSGEKPERLILQKEVESEFPDAVGSMWDYKIEADTDGGLEEGAEVALVFAPVKATMDVLSVGAIAADLKIEDVEPESFARRRGDDPVIEIAKKSLKGADKDVLNLKVEVVEDSKQEVVLSEKSGKEKITISKQTKKLVLILVGVILVGGVVIGGVLRSRSATKTVEPDPVISPVASVAPTPTPTPEPVELSTLSVQILNGSGVAGEAGVVSEILVAEGFEADKIEAGNADNYDYTKTEVQVKKGSSEMIFETIERALNSDYEVIPGEDLTESSNYDVVVIVGTKLITEEEI